MAVNWHVFKVLLARDMIVTRATLIPDGIDALILIALQYANFAWFLPLMGMSTSFIVPLFVGSVGNVFINTAFDRAISDSADASFTHFINYQMTLPLSLSWLFAQKMVIHMLSIGLYSVPALSVLLWFARDTLTVPGLFLFVCVYILSLVWVSALVMAVTYGTQFFWFIDNVWTRILMPILFLGCTFFPWKAVYALNQWLGALYALSPLTYTVEGMRSALIGSDQFISVYLCLGVLVLVAGAMVYGARLIFARRLYA